MFVQLTMIARFVVLVAAVAVDAHLLQTPALVLLLVLAGATVLAPALRGLVRTLLRSLSSAPHGPPGLARVEAEEFDKPTDPGTPGSVRARAPSPGVHAFA